MNIGPCIGGPYNGQERAYDGDSIDITDPWPDEDAEDFTYQWLKNTRSYSWDASRNAWVWSPLALFDVAKLAHSNPLIPWDDVARALRGDYAGMSKWHKVCAQREVEFLTLRRLGIHRHHRRHQERGAMPAAWESHTENGQES